MTTLLDANVLIALLVADHVHHDAAETWFGASRDPFATCPITEGALVRLLVREGVAARTAQRMLDTLAAHPRYEFWADDATYRDVPLGEVVGHRQVTDTYLVHLARSRGARLATMDRGLADQHGEVVDLVPAARPRA